MKKTKLKRSSALIIRRRKGLSFTPVAIQIGELPKKKGNNSER